MKKQKITKKEWTTKKRSAAPKKDGGTVNTNGEWTPAKRALFMEKVIEAGYRSLDLNEVAEEVSQRTENGSSPPAWAQQASACEPTR